MDGRYNKKGHSNFIHRAAMNNLIKKTLIARDFILVKEIANTGFLNITSDHDVNMFFPIKCVYSSNFCLKAQRHK